MSLASRVTLYASCIAAVSVIGYVHYKQYDDRKKLHEGVIRDIERQQMRKTENLYRLQQQDDYTRQRKAIELNENNNIKVNI